MKFNSNLSVGYSQIYLEDFSCEFHFHELSWTDEEYDSMLCVGRNYLIIGTASSIKVPFYLDVVPEQPVIDLNFWDQVNICSIEINSGLIVSGDFDTEGEMFRVNLDSSCYGVFVCYAGLETISENRLNGSDSYSVFMWPTKEAIQKQVLKKWGNLRH